jgi:hypothetical protein
VYQGAWSERRREGLVGHGEARSDLKREQAAQARSQGAYVIVCPINGAREAEHAQATGKLADQVAVEVVSDLKVERLKARWQRHVWRRVTPTEHDLAQRWEVSQS